MKNKLIKKIALYIAFLELFSISAKASDNTPVDYSLQTKIVFDKKAKPKKEKFLLVEDDENSPIYYILDNKTGEYCPISIFNYNNIYSKQYGANQGALSNSFNKMINDPIIFDEMQKYYPISEFKSFEEAMFFYSKYFDIIKDFGCGYAAATNFIFRIFEGREKDFYKLFGYPMYKVENNIIDFNYEYVMLEYFNFLNLKVKRNYRLIQQSMEKDFLEFQLNQYKKQNQIKNPSSEENWTQDDWNNWYAKGREINKTIDEMQEKINKAENLEINLGIDTNANFGDIYAFLKSHGILISASNINGLGTPSIDDIVASDNFDLYETDEDGCIKKVDTIDLHYIYITEIKEDGTILVSSWGNMYIFDYSDAKDTQKIVLKLSK